MPFLAIIKNPKPIKSVTVMRMESFVESSMPRFFTKLSRCFRYSFVPRNHVCRRWELLAKKNSVAR